MFRRRRGMLARVALEARTPSAIPRRVRRRYVLGLPCFPRSQRRLVAFELVVVQVEHARSASPVAAVVAGRLHGRDRPRIVPEERIAHDAKARRARRLAEFPDRARPISARPGSALFYAQSPPAARAPAFTCVCAQSPKAQDAAMGHARLARLKVAQTQREK